MAGEAKYLYLAMMDVEPEKEAESNEVYNREHIPVLLTVPGVAGSDPVRDLHRGPPKVRGNIRDGQPGLAEQ